MDSGGQFTQLYTWVPGYGTVVDSSLSCINEYLAMDSGGQFTQLYKWVHGYGQCGQFTQLYMSCYGRGVN